MTHITLREDRVQPGVHPFTVPWLLPSLDLQLSAPVTFLVTTNSSGAASASNCNCKASHLSRWPTGCKIQQVLVNLLQNGADALERSGEQARMLLITSRAEGADILVEVLDNGVGFDDTERLFDAFFTTKADGLGMGLAICRTIIDTHGGGIWAAHNEPQGAVFGFA